MVGLGIGFPYTMLSFYGLRELKAAHVGVLVNGMLPVFGAVAAWFILRQRISILRYGAIGLIFLANFIMAGGDTFSLEPYHRNYPVACCRRPVYHAYDRGKATGVLSGKTFW